jgi:predicted PurR-regulated permease PerM
VLYWLRSAIFPFVLGLLLAYVMVPFVSWFERKLPGKDKWFQAKRILTIALAYVVILGICGVFGFYLIATLADSFSTIITNAPDITTSALEAVQNWIESLRGMFPPEAQQQIQQYIDMIGAAAGEAVQNVFQGGVALIPSTIGFIFGLAVLPVFLFYILKDREQLKKSLYSGLSPRAAKHTANIVSIVGEILGRYIRAQLLLGLVVGVMVLVGLLILDVPFAPMLAVFAGVTEIIPFVGPWIGGITAVIITLATVPDKAIWVAVLFASVQLLENLLLVPRIQGAYLRMNPAIVIVLVVLGAYLAGFWGVLLAVPLAATIVEVYRYVRDMARIEDAPL